MKTTEELNETFQYWLMNMQESLEDFFAKLPEHVRSQLDFSAGSLLKLEGWLLEKYKNAEEVKPLLESKIIDGCARYIGEVLRRAYGGKWMIELKDERKAFFGLPQIAGMRGQESQICPLALVTTAVGRRTGKFFVSFFNNFESKA